MDNLENGRSNLIKVITSPLGFFALSLLIVEGFLTIVLIFSDLQSEDKFWGMIIGAGLFVMVVAGVWWLVRFHPKNLTFGEKAHLEEERIKMWGTSDDPQSKLTIEKEKPSAVSKS